MAPTKQSKRSKQSNLGSEGAARDQQGFGAAWAKVDTLQQQALLACSCLSRAIEHSFCDDVV